MSRARRSIPDNYTSLLAEVKERVRAAQYAALRAVNKELVALYWDIGRMTTERQATGAHGTAVVKRLAMDLQAEFPGIIGFSWRNLFNMSAFFAAYRDKPKLQPLAAIIGWTQNITIFQRCKDPLEREFYLRMTAKFGWTKNVLIHQIENQSYEKTLLGQTNFDKALTPKLRAQAKLAVKDEYTFKNNPKLSEGRHRFEEICVLFKMITNADPKFVTRVTINNNRQNPVEPWNLHANDLIQLELQDKFRTDLQIYYERQENAFDQLSTEDLEDYGIREGSKAIQMLKLTQTFLLTDGSISRLSEMRRVFEDDKVYEQVFRPARLKADSRQILLCYKVQFRLRKLAHEILQKGQNKYSFIHRSRYLLWALVCQALLNHDDLEENAEAFGTSMSVPTDYMDLLSWTTTRIHPLLKALMEDRDYADKVAADNLSFLRTDRAFDKCMETAYKKWRWVHKKLA